MKAIEIGVLVVAGSVGANGLLVDSCIGKAYGMMTAEHVAVEAARQGGDTIADARVIEVLPFVDNGTTIGFHDDYDETCPMDGIAPDVCYQYTPAGDEVVSVDLCGSAYDTKLFIRNDANETVACNDDYYFTPGDVCGMYVSRIDEVVMLAGRTYYIIIDGNGTDAGEYHIEVFACAGCELAIPADATWEGEPEIVDGYEDQYNGGCSSPQFGYPVQTLAGDEAGRLTLAGKTGWYDDSNGDADWYRISVGGGGMMRLSLAAEFHTILLVYTEFDCAPFGWDMMLRGDRCEGGELEIHGSAGSPIWVRIQPTGQAYPCGLIGHEYHYLVTFDGLQSGGVQVERTTWSRVKSTFGETR
jgi:hypothetical protein